MTPLESFLAWARYLYWADLHRQRYFEFFEGPLDAPTENEHTALFVALSGQWFASLWVVVEGWQTLGVKDHFIDGLLAHRRDYATLLRRFRNGIYHFQPRLLDQRIRGIMEIPDEALPWTYALHAEFCRYLWDRPATQTSSFAEAAELRETVGSVLGWLPNDSIPARITSLEAVVREAERLLASDPNAAELQNCVQEGRSALVLARRQHLEHQQRYVDHGWIPGVD